jgi:predicted PurR-regulated permease PerM
VHRNAPAALRPYVEQWQDDVSRILGGFVRGQLVLALIMGTAAGLSCLLLGLQLWLLIGIFVVLAALIPVVGPYLGAIPAVISAALSQHGHFSPTVRVVAVIVVFFIINEFGSKVLYPRLVGAALGLHEIIVLFALLAGFEVGHLPGVLFAAPLLALSIVTVTHLYRFWQGLPPLSLSDTARAEGAVAKAAGTP